MDVKFEEFDKGQVIYLSGRLDMAGAEEVESSMGQLRAAPLEGKVIIVSFADVHYISSSGLRTIVAAFNHIHDQNGKMVLCQMDIGVHEVFEFAGLTEVFTITETVEEAKGIDT